ncbi:hypothetical protein Moror_767 [Moniliophthora roreri MCA 2997]|uniref:Uncharacterized protein n=2 Tax=Moniliophthora roreri TaxID=221103 RepID=V2YDZ0_MONRO|nr:hypothetical protein Moror_767 [Moniliophthora roreri MCA 2997]KAI3612785.1 hypothetical protein WG66_014659 [Moniliophthora roreri]
MSAGRLSQNLKKVAASWPKDPYRPHLQLSILLESLSKHPKLTPEAVRAAQDLLGDTVKKTYPVSEKISRPASVPLHYERLVEGFQKSAQGIARPWWKRLLGIW